MPTDYDHRASVDAWMQSVHAAQTPETLIPAFEETFGRIWKRAQRTLADVTLTAILDRVLYTTAERYPVLSAATIHPSGLQCQELRLNAENLNGGQLAEAIRFLLIEFLTVLGNLTADLLTPALHDALVAGSTSVPGSGTHTESEMSKPKTSKTRNGAAS